MNVKGSSANCEPSQGNAFFVSPRSRSCQLMEGRRVKKPVALFLFPLFPSHGQKNGKSRKMSAKDTRGPCGTKSLVTSTTNNSNNHNKSTTQKKNKKQSEQVSPLTTKKLNCKRTGEKKSDRLFRSIAYNFGSFSLGESCQLWSRHISTTSPIQTHLSCPS